MRIFIAFLTGLLWCVYPCHRTSANELEVRVLDEDAGVQVARQVMQNQERFILHYIHSVEKTLVEEIYEVSADGDIFLVETTVGSSGYGLPECAPGQDCDTIDGHVVFQGLHLKIDNLIMRVSYLNDMCLIFKNMAVNLRQVAPSGHRILIQARPVVQNGNGYTRIVARDSMSRR